MKKAYSLNEIDYAVRFDIPVDPSHPFFVDFSGVRGDYQEKLIYKELNVDPIRFTFNPQINASNKTVLFLGGMRGSGKTSEISKYVKNLNNPNCFFCITCNVDEELDLNDIEYMDILIFQLEKLIKKAEEIHLNLDEGILGSLQNWFSQRVKEINKSIKAEGGFEIEVGAESPSFFSFLKIAAKLKSSILGSKETATKIRTNLKNNFTDFANKFNEFIGEVNLALRNSGIAQEVLFVVDGLEKTMSVETRRKIIIDESNRIRQIKANTLFTLPIELMRESNKLKTFTNVISFPFVKIIEKGGKYNETAIQKFFEFVDKRIDKKLFDSEETIRKAILLSGGSPRELLRILEYANLYADENIGIVNLNALNSAIEKLAAESAQYLTEEDLEYLKELADSIKNNKMTPFNDILQDLLERLIVFEYNDGTYKRVNPIVEASQIYKQYVG